MTSESYNPAEALLTFLRGVLGADLRYAEVPASMGRGFDTLIFRFRIAGNGVRDAWAAPLVLRVYGTPSQDAKAQREAAVQRFVAKRAFPVLEPLALETSAGMLGLPFMIMPLVDGGTMLECITKRPWQAPRLFREMGRLHATLHRLQHDGAPLPHEGATIDRFVSATGLMIAASGLNGLDDALAWTERHAGAVRDEASSLVHGDFHPLNILMRDGYTPVVIDWSDATIGDRHADVARTLTLLWFAQIAASSAIERTLLKLVRGRMRAWYLSGYQDAFPVEPTRLAFWEAAQALRGIAQVMEVHASAQNGIHDLARRLPESLVAQGRAYFDAKKRAFEVLAPEHAAI